MIIYWIALPLALLVCVGGLISALTGPPTGSSWMMVVGSGLFASVIGWRLWLNSRALGRTGPLPPTRRLLLVVLPLAILALAGLALAALGFVWLVIGVWLLLGPEATTSGYRDLVSGAALPIGGGALMVLVGALLVLPLLRSLKTHTQPADTF